MAEQNNSPIINVTTANIGLNLDSSSDQIQKGELTYALNAQVENFDGNMVSYQNEQGNILCITFPEGYKVIGCKNIISLNRCFYFIVNPTTGDSEIGYSDSDSCIYNTLIADKNNNYKLNFKITNPIHKVVVKTTNCSTQLYWTDGLNPRRYIDLDDLPWQEVTNPDNDYKPTKLVGKLDANKMLVQPNFSVPRISINAVDIGGKLISGTYQFAVQYANSLGEDYTSFYSVTNPVSIFEGSMTNDYAFPTSKSIQIFIESLDTSGLYEHINIAVIKNINNNVSVELIGTFPVTESTMKYTYTGENQSDIRLSILDIFEKFPYYNSAEDVFEVDNVLGWANLIKNDRVNYQSIWSKVKLYWETWKVPYNDTQGYKNGLNTANIKGYMRDEVYPFEGCFILKNGQQTDSFHIPGRVATEFDRELIPYVDDNTTVTVSQAFDNVVKAKECDSPQTRERWQVYNTGSVIDFDPEFKRSGEEECYLGPYQYGNFSYIESDERYPNNKDIWGSLANEKIRHHKFPDSLVTHIYKSYPGSSSINFTYDESIFPIGVRIDASSLYDAIIASNLTFEQKNDIVGFKITRGNRTVHNSIIAKGLAFNVGKTTFDERPYYYPNYPYNDLRKDPYFASAKVENHTGYNENLAIEGFNTTDSRVRFVFHSPDTNFNKPTLSNDGESLKIETIEYGKSIGHFVKLKDNAEYKFLTRRALKASTLLGIASGLNIGAGSDPDFNLSNVGTGYTNALELFSKVTPLTNFGYSYYSVGNYSSSYPVPNNGNKIRSIDFNRYITDGENRIEDGNILNNFRRESSVYIKTGSRLLYPHEYNSSIPLDTSRINLSNSTSYAIEKVKYVESTVITDYIILNVARVDFAYLFPGIIYSGMEVVSTSLTPNFIDKSKYDGTIKLKIINPGGTLSPSGYVVKNTFTVSGPERIDYFSYATQQEITHPLVEVRYTGDGGTPEALRTENISAFYTSIKRYLPGQWGRIYSYETIDTGFYSILYKEVSNGVMKPAPLVSYASPDITSEYQDDYGFLSAHESDAITVNDGSRFSKFPTIFGGDTFINRFGLKTKLPIFKQNTVGLPDQSDIAYDELGNINNPMFYISTKPIEGDLTDIIENQVDTLLNDFNNDIGTELKGIFKSAKEATKVVRFFRDLLTKLYETIGIKNINVDRGEVEGLDETGITYMFVYGVPYFFVESTVNVDYRQAINDKEGNFYPNVGTGVPDEWFQEINVPIANDNTYYYNQSYSKQNKENLFTHLREDFDITKLCNTLYPNRAIYSDRSNLEETKNNWLVYRPISYFDFSKSYGTLTSLDSLDNIRVLARFENKSQIFNTLTRIRVDGPQDVLLGNGRLFSETPPMDLSETDSGYAGSQNKLLLKTEFGTVFVDAIRGQIVLLNGNNLTNLANAKMSKWFKENLPFKLSKNLIAIDTDNAFYLAGLTGVYDDFNQRLILTKKDYELKPEYIEVALFDYDTMTIANSNGAPFNVEGDPFPNVNVNIGANAYFNDKSWTLSYSFKTNSWTSFHSYTPNYYIAYPNYFQSGTNEDEQLWSHNKTFTLYNSFYGDLYPYILEYPFAYKFHDEILQNVREYCVSKKYTDFNNFYQPDSIMYFNKSIIYNGEECTGLLNLIPSPVNDLSARFKYPLYNADSKDILVAKSDNFFNYNTFWNVVVDNNKPFFTTSDNLRLTDKELDNTNLDYSKKSFAKGTIRGKDLKIRHILDDKNDVKLISRFIINSTVNSY